MQFRRVNNDIDIDSNKLLLLENFAFVFLFRLHSQEDVSDEYEAYGASDSYSQQDVEDVD